MVVQETVPLAFADYHPFQGILMPACPETRMWIKIVAEEFHSHKYREIRVNQGYGIETELNQETLEYWCRYCNNQQHCCLIWTGIVPERSAGGDHKHVCWLSTHQHETFRQSLSSFLLVHKISSCMIIWLDATNVAY